MGRIVKGKPKCTLDLWLEVGRRVTGGGGVALEKIPIK